MIQTSTNDLGDSQIEKSHIISVHLHLNVIGKLMFTRTVKGVNGVTWSSTLIFNKSEVKKGD